MPQAAADSASADGKNLPQLVANSDEGRASADADWLLIPWGHIRLLIDKCKGDRGKALFYVRKTVEDSGRGS